MGALRYVRMVLWSFLGIRRRAGADEELARARPVPLLVTALLLAAVFVGLLMSVASMASAATPVRVDGGMSQRVAACTACHGGSGRTTRGGYFPRIAGKPAGYLFNQLQHFRDGRREHAAMAHLLVHLTDDYLRQIATHFATLDLPYPAPQPAGPAAARGERLVRQGDAARGIPACVQCHGHAVTGLAPSTPGLLGLPRDYLVAQLGGWRTGLRRAAAPDCMATIAQHLSVDDIDAVSAWLAAQPVPRGPAPTAPSARGALDCGSTR